MAVNVPAINMQAFEKKLFKQDGEFKNGMIHAFKILTGVNSKKVSELDFSKSLFENTNKPLFTKSYLKK